MRGLLLVNVGTPDDPNPPAVRRFLREFLGDPRVLTMNAVGRFLLLRLVILPFRPKRSAHAYQQIWTEDGSPILVHGRALASAVAERLGEEWRVELAMRYGNPSISRALHAFEGAGVDQIVALPLFPQRAASTTDTAVEAVVRALRARESAPGVSFVEPFYQRDDFIAAFAEVGRPALDAARADHVLFSFHGLPESHVRRADPSGNHCLVRDDCCHAIEEANRHCYRAQCFATARALAGALSLGREQWTTCFQSRLGRVPWIEPHTDEVIVRLAESGARRLAVFCPAFVADCLETLEEIGIRGRESFIAAGGEELVLVPSLNSSPSWADAVARMAEEAAEAPAVD